MLVSYAYGWLPIYPPTIRPSVCLSACHLCFSQRPLTVPSPFRPPAAHLSVDCPSPFRPSTVRLSTDCRRRFIRRRPVCLSTRRSVHSCFLNVHWLSPRRFDRRLSVYPPTVRLPVRLPTFSCFPPNCLSSFRPPAVRLSADCPSVHRLSVAV